MYEGVYKSEPRVNIFLTFYIRYPIPHLPALDLQTLQNHLSECYVYILSTVCTYKWYEPSIGRNGNDKSLIITIYIHGWTLYYSQKMGCMNVH